MTVETGSGPLLRVAGLCAGYGDLTIVTDIDVEVGAGEVVGLVGANGAGKSTLLSAIAGAARSTAGQIEMAGRSIRGRKPEDIVRTGLALVPEGRHIFTGLTVEENLSLGLIARRRSTGAAAAIAEVTDLFPVLSTHRKQAAGMLSGGQQQQLAIARALVAEPLLVMLDEPSLGLSPTVVRDVFGALDRIVAAGTAVLIVEQRANLVIGMAARTLVLREGRVRDTLTPADVANHERLSRAYFGTEVPV